MAPNTTSASSTSAQPGKVLASSNPGSFQRATTKFWVPLERLETVKARIAKNIPIYKFDKNQPVPAYTNSVYMDSTDLSCYYNRLRRVEDAFLIRLRWYANDYNKIFVERKVHHESWGGEVTVKSRFTCHAADVPRFLSGEYELETHLTHANEFRELPDQVTELFNEFREKITNTRLFPLIRTKYARTAFQHTPHVDCRASLDEELQMMLEPVEPGQFRRAENVSVREDQVLRFPYGVFELKVENPEAFEDAWPEWVQEMVEDGSLIEVYKFSKFLTGIAWLLPERTTVNPAWLPLISEKVHIIDPHRQRSGDIPKDVIHPDQILTRDYKLTQLGHSLLYPTPSVALNINDNDLNTPLLSNSAIHQDEGHQFRQNYNDTIARTTFPKFPINLFEGKPILVPMKIEPKVFFANERTMIHWGKFGATIGIVGAILCGIIPLGQTGEKEKITGLLLTLFGVSLMTYGFTMFRFRTKYMKLRCRGPYDDPVGPVILVIAFVFMLSVRLIMDSLDGQDAPIPINNQGCL